MQGLALTPEADVLVKDGRLVATTTEPWLRLAAHPVLRPGDLVEITYRTSFWDEPVRPVFRFRLSSGDWDDRIAPGPVAGSAVFVTRIPKGTAEVSVSPTCRLGRFDFEITEVRRVSFLGELLRAVRWRPREVRSAILTRLIGWDDESDVNLTWASASMPVSRYEHWRARRGREIDLAGIDAPRADWAGGVEVRLFVDARAGDEAALHATVESLRAQVFSRWRLDVVTDRDLGALASDPRIGPIEPEEIPDHLMGCGPGTFVAALAPGDRLYPRALATVVEAAAGRPDIRIFYGDEDLRRDDGTLVPVMKPGFSPLLESARPFLGRAVLVRGDLLGGWSDQDRMDLVIRAEVPAAATARLVDAEIASLRRILLTRASPWPVPERRPAAPAPPIVHLQENPSALIVIPTRDRAGLLARCIESIFERTAFSNFSIVIVDNDSVEPETMRLFDHFHGDKHVSVLHAPGPFNYSALCNAAAARRRCDVLVFLNNDTEVLSENWLGRLVETALRPVVGAVGGLLLYPDRRIQHAGVVLGMGNSAGHLGAGAPEAAPGWLSRNEVLHEVSAVTGACLAVARRKFMLVGGFDAEHLPIELGDIDLCLRLAEKGWRTLLDPGVRLVHAESASRGGATFRRLHVYAEQRRWLHRRWLHALRDDPYFHPGLSLYSRDVALG